MSKFVTLHGFGGSGGADLNFEVVGGTTEPTNPKENTIWVNTDTHITGWIFDVANPFLKTTDIYTSESLKSGYYLNTSGTEKSASGSSVTEKIVLPSNAVSVTITAGSSTTSTVSHAFYDVDEGLISTVLRKTGEQTYVIPSGAKTIRVSFEPDDTKSILVNHIVADEGMVWIYTGTSSDVDFNALKMNYLQIYPISVKQCIDGTLIDISAMIYQNGKWNELIDWVSTLIASGIVTTEYGTLGNPNRYTFYSTSHNRCTFNYTTDNGKCILQWTYYSGSVALESSYAYFSKKVNLSDATTIKIKTGFVDRATDEALYGLYVISNIGDSVNGNGYIQASVSTYSDSEATLDVSGLSGEYYLAIMIYGTQNNFYMEVIDLKIV